MSDKEFGENHFAEMLCTRFCHDIAGAISAINNGLEFMDDGGNDPEMFKQANDLLKLSAKEALAKLQVYRMAYGRAAGSNETKVEELREIIERFFENNRIELDWPGDGEDKVDNEIRRVLINMILIVASLLIYGGKLSVNIGKGKVVVAGENDRVKIDDETKEIYDGKVKRELTPHNIPAMFLYNVALEKNVKLSFSEEETKIEFTADY